MFYYYNSFIYNYLDNKISFKEVVDLPNSISSGWGITNSDTELIISDGTSKIYFVDPDNLEVRRSVVVTFEKLEQRDKLNELEFIKGKIYANIWYENNIVVIDPASGDITK